MELKAKNKEVFTLIDMDHNAPKDNVSYMNWYDDLSTYDRDRIIVAGFFNGFEGICETISLNMDLSYETIGNFGDAILANYIYHKNVDKVSYEDNLDLLAHCIAAYLTFLSMNEHNCYMDAIPYNTNDKSYHPNYLWADFLEIKVSGLRELDLLPACKKAFAAISDKNYDDEITLDLSPVFDRYKRLTDVNLNELGAPVTIVLKDKE